MHEAAGAPACCSSPATRRSRFCATTSLRGGIPRRRPGFIISALNAYYVFLKFASSGSCSTQDAERRPTYRDLLAPPSTLQARRAPRTTIPTMFSLHIDTARTWRGGQNQVLLTVNGLREIGHRAALVAHPDGELRRRATEGLELIPLAPRTEMDLSAAWRLSRVVKRLRPDVSTRTIRTAWPWRRWRCRSARSARGRRRRWSRRAASISI